MAEVIRFPDGAWAKTSFVCLFLFLSSIWCLLWKLGVEERLLVFSTTNVCATKKKQKLFECLMLRAPPIPQNSKLRGAAAHGFTRFAFFLAGRRTHVRCSFNFELGGEGGRTAEWAKWFCLYFRKHRNKIKKCCGWNCYRQACLKKWGCSSRLTPTMPAHRQWPVQLNGLLLH